MLEGRPEVNWGFTSRDNLREEDYEVVPYRGSSEGKPKGNLKTGARE
jgi:hypothetical protein